jgi:2-polyprenyl-3-methyl-5-hydroxy-6-metoxy-1,4-benzoquinol methylase
MKLGYKNVIGCDVDKNALEIARQHGLNVENCSDLDSFSRKYQDYFDFIIMSHVLEHFPKDRIVPALKSIRAMLKSGGGCYLSWFLMLKVTQEHTGHMKILRTLLYLLLVVYIMFLKWQVLMK